MYILYIYIYKDLCMHICKYICTIYTRCDGSLDWKFARFTRIDGSLQQDGEAERSMPRASEKQQGVVRGSKYHIRSPGHKHSNRVCSICFLVYGIYYVVYLSYGL